VNERNPGLDRTGARDEAKITWVNDQPQDIASPQRPAIPTCPFCGVQLNEPDNVADHEDWCRDGQLAAAAPSSLRLDIRQWIKPISPRCPDCWGAA
jgi:hypothetical protein